MFLHHGNLCWHLCIIDISLDNLNCENGNIVLIADFDLELEEVIVSNYFDIHSAKNLVQN